MNIDAFCTLLQVASYLDPSAHQYLSSEEKRITHLTLETMLQSEGGSHSHGCDHLSTLKSKNQSNLLEKLRIMVGGTPNKPSSISMDDEMTLFSQSIHSFDGDFSTFWIQNRQQFPRLFRLAQRFSIIAATSVPSESAFSIAGFINRKQRSALSSNSLRRLVMLKESHRFEVLRSRTTHDG